MGVAIIIVADIVVIVVDISILATIDGGGIDVSRRQHIQIKKVLAHHRA